VLRSYRNGRDSKARTAGEDAERAWSRTRSALEGLEPYDGKLSCTVLKGGEEPERGLAYPARKLHLSLSPEETARRSWKRY